MFELYTHDIVAATSSKGNQEKWYDAPSDHWYKLDTGAFEALSETIASFILSHSNLSDLGFSSVPYQIEKVRVHGREQIACVSPNFLHPSEEIVTLAHLLKAELGADYQRIFHSRSSIPLRIQTLVEQVEQITGLTRFGAYLTLLFEYDALILNDDRHLNNIAVLYTPTGYRYCPLFDHGAGFLLDPVAYAFDIETNALVKQAIAKPFRCKFYTQVNATRKLYSPQLKLSLTSSEIQDAVQQAVAHYPALYHAVLRDRVMNVLDRQRKMLKL